MTQTLDTWTGCYPSKWAGIILPESMTHPAKFSSRLIARIYEHILQEQWVARGDTIIDPFGGVALGSWQAQKHGLRWRGVELEERFYQLGNQNIESWNARFSRMPGWSTDAALLHGDSRHLLEFIGRADAAISSPPFGSALSDDGLDPSARRALARKLGISNAEHISPIDMEKIGQRKRRGYSGDRIVAVSSPPYSEARIGQESRQESCGHGDQYGATPGQLGAMKAGDFSAAISSPPYTGNVQVEKNSKSINRDIQYQAYKASGGGQSFEAFCHTQDIHSQGYGSSAGQLANMPEGSFQIAVSSPPYESDALGHKGKPNDIDISKGLHSRIAGAKYGDTEGNIGNERGDDFWTAARTIVEQTYAALEPGGHAVWVCKAYVKDKAIVDFPGQWRQLCEAVGFETLHEHHAMLIKHNGTSRTLDGGTVEHKKEYVSFFRRLAQSKGSPRIDFETVYCMQKPEASSGE